jgi:hypothetical protein
LLLTDLVNYICYWQIWSVINVIDRSGKLYLLNLEEKNENIK